MATLKSYQLIVLGAGSGGLVTTAGATMLGARVALIEKHRMGGDCLNTGCVPSKAMIRAAKLAAEVRRADAFGLSAELASVDLDQVLASVRAVIAKIAPHDSVERFTSLGAEVYQGAYRFASPFELTDGNTRLTAKRIVIATGSSPRLPKLPGLTAAPYVTSENVWELKHLPKRLVVLGGGPIGCELAQCFARFGSRVTIVQSNPRLLPREDPEVSALMQQCFSDEGIEVLTQHTAESVIQSADTNDWSLQVRNAADELKSVGYDQLLIAIGRVPNIADLDLAQAGVQTLPRGIAVDSYLRSSAKHIYACGDVVGPYLFTHTADHQARTVLRNALFPGKSKVNYQVIPWSTFTDPEVARVGLNEIEATEQNITYEVHRYPMKDLDRAVCDRETTGFLKVLTPKGKDKILGATLVGTHAGDLISELVMAMQQKIGLKALANQIHIYPTLAEINKRVAGEFQRKRLSAGLKKWIGRYLRWSLG